MIRLRPAIAGLELNSNIETGFVFSTVSDATLIRPVRVGDGYGRVWRNGAFGLETDASAGYVLQDGNILLAVSRFVFPSDLDKIRAKISVRPAFFHTVLYRRAGALRLGTFNGAVVLALVAFFGGVESISDSSILFA